MRIDLLTSNDTQVRGPPPTSLSMWRVGAILDAIAVRDAASGQLWLEMQNRRLPARIASGNEGPANGEQLKLRVLRDSPVLALETLDGPPQADVTGAALRRHLPQQTVPTPLLANLAWLMRDDGAAALPNGIAAAVKQLWQNLPTAASLSDPAALAEALEKSGVFLEAALARSPPGAAPADILAQDFKAQLMALKQALNAAGVQTSHPNGASPGPLPALGGALTPLNTSPASFAVMENSQAQLQELAQQTHGSLARVVSTQLINAEAAQTGVAACLIEIPYRQEDRADLLRLRFEREKENGAEGEAGWTVEAALDLGITGNLHARVTLQGKRLTVQLRSESPLLVSMLDRHAPTLAAALRADGFVIDRIACLHGAPVRDPGEQVLRLLDVHA